jgi:hypothetical protein
MDSDAGWLVDDQQMTVFEKHGKFSARDMHRASLGKAHGRDADRIPLDQPISLRYASFVDPDLPGTQHLIDMAFRDTLANS